jgi:hypothetical protein
MPPIAPHAIALLRAHSERPRRRFFVPTWPRPQDTVLAAVKAWPGRAGACNEGPARRVSVSPSVLCIHRQDRKTDELKIIPTCRGGDRIQRRPEMLDRFDDV